MRLESIPSVLMSPEFLDRIRTDINLNQIQHKSRRKKAERFARAMVSVALDSLQHFKSTNFYLRTVEAPSSKLTQLVGQNSTREFFAVLAACQWKVDHSYSTGIGNTNKESKKIGIPVAVHRRMLEFLQEQGLSSGAASWNRVETSWAEAAIEKLRKDGRQRYHSFQLPSAVRINAQRLLAYAQEQEASGQLDVFERLQARVLLELASQNDGWIEQRYREAPSGRVYGRGLGNLVTTKKVLLEQMLAGCWQLDIQAAGQTLLPQICRKVVGDQSLIFDGLEGYAKNRKELRKQWATEVGCSAEAIKQAVTALLYGSSVAAKEMEINGRKRLSALRKILGSEQAVRRFRSIDGIGVMEKDIRRVFKLVTTGLNQESVLDAYGLDRVWIDQATKSEMLAMVYQKTESQILAGMLDVLDQQVVISKHDALIILDRLDQVDVLETLVDAKTGYRIRLDQEQLGCD